MNSSLQQQLENSASAFAEWKNTSFEDRQKHLKQLSKNLHHNKQEFAELITSEMNKPIAQSVSEIEKCIGMCYYYASAPDVLAVEKVKTDHGISEIHHEPLGVILGIMPWNFPFWQVLRFAVPAILAGNCVVLKHASICHGSGDALQRLFQQSRFPDNIFSHLRISHEEVADALASPIIKGVSLTGSEAAGRKIAALAGQNLKKCVLELGGSDPFIVLDDADLGQAAKDAAQARLQNAGQTCVAAKRFIVHEKIYDKFQKLLIKEYEAFRPEDPNNPETKLSGMAREDLADDLEKQYEEAIAEGAEVVQELQRKDRISFQPALLEMNEENPVAQQELFGPVGMIFRAENDEHALQLANSTDFGLAAAVYTKDRARAFYFVNNLESGSVAVNQIFHSDWRLPFGGRKNSGYGVELSLYALHEFTVKKSVIGEI